MSCTCGVTIGNQRYGRCRGASRSRYGGSSRGDGRRSGIRTAASWGGETGGSARRASSACGLNTSGGAYWAAGYYRCSRWIRRRSGDPVVFRMSTKAGGYGFSGGGSGAVGYGYFRAIGGSCSACSYGRGSWSWRGASSTRAYGYSGSVKGGTCRSHGGTRFSRTGRRQRRRATKDSSGLV